MPTMTASAVTDDTEEGAWWRPAPAARRTDTYAASAEYEVDPESQLARAGLPVIERLAEDLGDLAISIELTDVRANVIGRVVGAHAPASTLHRRGASVAAPITDPRRDVPVGAVRVTCAIPDASALMLAYAQLAARTIAERIVDRAAVADRELLEQFLRARRRARGPILAVNSNELLTNAAAARLVHPDDHARIWNWALNAVESNEPAPRELRLGARTVTARCEPVRHGRDTVGALVHVEEPTPTSPTAGAGRTRSRGRPKFGWESLRSSELGIAELVAEGLTNREIAARIFVSPHTVDFHLRQIYRKLSITSRIELTRRVLEHTVSSVGTAAGAPV
jgi:DNA-binding CsgD family transcriptional regulator